MSYLLTGSIPGQRLSRSPEGITPGSGRLGGRYGADLDGPALAADIAAGGIRSPCSQACASLRRAQQRRRVAPHMCTLYLYSSQKIRQALRELQWIA